MKKLLLNLLFLSFAVSAHAQTAAPLAGWDCNQVVNLDQSVDGYANDKPFSNNGFSGGGYLSTELPLSTSGGLKFAANGRQASGTALQYGFDNKTTTNVGSTDATGQQSLNIYNAPSASFHAFTVHFNDSTNVTMDFDTAGGNGQGGWNFEYSTDGGSTFTSAGSHTVFGTGNNTWTTSEQTGGFYGFVGQAGGTLDLSSVIDPINAIKFNVKGATVGERIGIDNILVQGITVVPEPSTYALILGIIAFGFMSLSRKRQK